jgi:hypothetical protein
MRAALRIAVIWIVVCGAACSGDKKELAQKAIEQFHHKLNAEQYPQIYADADADLRKGISEPDFVAILASVHAKLGTVRRSTNRNYMAGFFTDRGVLINVLQETTFSEGIAEEQFVWRLRSGSSVLVSYHIRSAKLELP